MVLSLLLLAGLTGCAEVSGIVSETEAPIAADTSVPVTRAETVAPTEPEPLKPAIYVIGVNAIVQREGEWRVLRLDEAAEVSIIPLVPEDMVFDHWEVDGIAVGGGEGGLKMNISETTVAEAVLRPMKKVVSLSSSMQLVNEKRKSKGDNFDEFEFEFDYVGFDGSVMSGGSVSLSVEAEIPDDKSMDYWLINGVPYFFGGEITGFTVMGLDSAMVYEAVLRNKDAAPTVPASNPPETAVLVLPVDLDGSVSSGEGYEQYAVGVNCTLNDVAMLTLNGETEIIAKAAPAEHETIDHWEIDGVRVEGVTDSTLTFIAGNATIVRAVMREQSIVKTENAYMQFIDANGKPDGGRFHELMFDGEYDALGVTMPGGTVTVHVCAETVKGKAVHGWRVDSVDYYLNARIDSFVVQGLDSTTLYEPIYYTITVSTPNQTSESTPEPSPTLEPTPQPQRDDDDDDPPSQPDPPTQPDPPSQPDPPTQPDPPSQPDPPTQPDPPSQPDPPFDPGGGYVGGGTIAD